ncbi:hypothetical protein DLD99_06135 [Pseudomonas kribbensis]|uniref:Uncharacterized protein n=1 Tax=Pseudomonas kribbensis TaxID=1628086 RepID=A0A345RL97_9PSED|nr:hypothetical protein [Pseudomonas kribbensis]AXI60063.1 hypothetical protein DLD99_06135 [Pseudomonas kribbensis]
MLRSAVLELATSFRLAVEIVVDTGNVPMHIQGFPRGCCGIISELMGEYCNTLGIGEVFYVCGMKDGASHAWLEVDGLIVDITGDQFSDRPGIYVDKPDAWYFEWEENTRHLAIHDQTAFFYGEERRFLGRVLEQLNRGEPSVTC